MNIIMKFNRDYAEAILDGEKMNEIRKTRYPKDVDYIFIFDNELGHITGIAPVYTVYTELKINIELDSFLSEYLKDKERLLVYVLHRLGKTMPIRCNLTPILTDTQQKHLSLFDWVKVGETNND